MKDTISSFCKGLGVHDNIITALLSSTPDAFIRWLLGEEYVTAEIMDSIILYWPCKPVEKWYPNRNKSDCYADLPIQLFIFINQYEKLEYQEDLLYKYLNYDFDQLIIRNCLRNINREMNEFNKYTTRTYS